MAERERNNTLYYDAQSSFGTPPSMNNKTDSIGGLDRDDEEMYERVHHQRRAYSFQRRDGPNTGVPPVIQAIRRTPNSVAPITMPPASPSYDWPTSNRAPNSFDYGHELRSNSVIGPTYHRRESGGGARVREEYKPHRDANESREMAALTYVRRATASELPPLHQPSRSNKDFAVVGAYGTENERHNGLLYGRDVRATSREGLSYGHGLNRTRPEELIGYSNSRNDPRLNVTFPQYTRGESDVAPSRATNDQLPPLPRGEHSPRRRYPSGGSFGSSPNKHLYEEVPISNISGYGYEKETAILDDDLDNSITQRTIPNQRRGSVEAMYPGQLKQASNRSRLDTEDADLESDAHSAVYQPGNYQPSEDAGSSSDEDDPELLELLERDNIINRYETGPDSKDVDPWENPNFEVYTKTDRFGFVHKEGEKFEEAQEAYRRRVIKELSREKKWLKMIEVWKSGGPSKKMEDRIWKGIPEKLRMVVWPRLLGAEGLRREKQNVYGDLLVRARLVSKDIKQIDLDINRTYRDHLAFRKRYDVKQKSLLNVLAAYSMYNTEVGYCQGMSQIAALFLMYLDEEDTFWCLHNLMVSPKHTMHGFFVPGFPKLSRFEEHFKRVLKKYKPRVFKHLEKQDIPYIYLTKWWFGCFLDRVPFSLALRLWDVFLIEGDPVLIAMALNIMKMHEKTIRKLSLETFMEFVQNDIANDFGYSDDETMRSLRETISRLKSDRQHVPPPPRPEDLSEVPTKALGPILQKPMSTIREEIHEIQSRRSRANSTGRSPYPKRKESARKANGPPPVVNKWNGNASQDSIVANGREVPFEIPSRRSLGGGSQSGVAVPNEPPMHHSNGGGATSKLRNHDDSARVSGQTAHARGTPTAQRLRDERNGQMVVLSRASDSDGEMSPSSPLQSSQVKPSYYSNHQPHHRPQTSTTSLASARITHASNHVTRIELDGDVSVI